MVYEEDAHQHLLDDDHVAAIMRRYSLRTKTEAEVMPLRLDVY